MDLEVSPAFIEKAIRRKQLFLRLSIIGVVFGLGLSIYFAWQVVALGKGELGLRGVVVILVLLNARQNLRQFKYATALEKAWKPRKSDDPTSSRGT